MNEDPNEKVIKGLRDEIEALKRKLLSGGGAGGGGPVGSETEREKLRAEFAAQRDAEMAAMREELAAKLRQELEAGKSWEQRLAETAQRSAEKERELAEMGMLTGPAREAQLEKARTVPHLTNLHEDRLMSEQVGRGGGRLQQDKCNPKPCMSCTPLLSFSPPHCR